MTKKLVGILPYIYFLEPLELGHIRLTTVVHDDPDRAGDPIAAIHQLNLMDGVYRNKGEVAVPSGSSTVVVVEETSG